MNAERGARQSASMAAYEPESGAGTGGDHRRTGRFWSARRVPAALLALAVAAAAGLLLYDVAAVRAGRTAMEWRSWLADQLATRTLDDGWVVGVAAALVVVGVWMVVLAVTPGLRGLLPMRETDGIRAGIDRGAAGLVLRDRAMEVSGVRSVRVSVSRHRVRARAQAHFRDLDEVRADLVTVLGEGIRQLGLARQPGLTVRVRRPAKG
ncbi:DUF6286 domain-containing protein [Streptomyces coffeae]|uniref:DUF6286 domain-containing protein n=1 Tax=Streptomyces coffeae TaxID=621382 RepID=A0ABS1NBI8_9ACTN|nr:hypothetical protein [Streptomyces coffeae]